jgi:DNA-binding IclR family transcriptional regulator
MKKDNSQMRILKIIRELFRYHVTGLTNKNLAEILCTSEANITRDLAILKEMDWIQRRKDGGWRLSPAFGNLSVEIIHSYQAALQKLVEDKKNWDLAVQKESAKYE